MKRKSGKLILSRETVRRLTGSDLMFAVGGATRYCGTSEPSITCDESCQTCPTDGLACTNNTICQSICVQC